MQHDDAGQTMQVDDSAPAMQHGDAAQVAELESSYAVDEGRRKLLTRGKLALPVVLTLTVSNGLCVS